MASGKEQQETARVAAFKIDEYYYIASMWPAA